MATKLSINGDMLISQGWQQGKPMGLALAAAKRLHEQGMDDEAILGLINTVRDNPQAYVDDKTLGGLAKAVLKTRPVPMTVESVLRDVPLTYPVWGKDGIDAAALLQMDNAMRLPVSVAGALMPDAHVGYGLPIGGVLATEGAVIPYAVGVDIACRMRLSVLDASPIVLNQQKGKFETVLRENTRFGAGVEWNPRQDDDVLDDPDWNATRFLKSLQGKAAKQLGTSGSGNHGLDISSSTSRTLKNGSNAHFLRYHAERAPRLPVFLDHVVPEHRDTAGIQARETGEDIDERGFAGTVRSEQAEEFATPDIEVHALRACTNATGTLCTPCRVWTSISGVANSSACSDRTVPANPRSSISSPVSRAWIPAVSRCSGTTWSRNTGRRGARSELVFEPVLQRARSAAAEITGRGSQNRLSPRAFAALPCRLFKNSIAGKSGSSSTSSS